MKNSKLCVLFWGEISLGDWLVGSTIILRPFNTTDSVANVYVACWGLYEDIDKDTNGSDEKEDSAIPLVLL